MIIAEYTAVTGRALARALQSLSASTSLTVTCGQVAYRGDGLNSPYLTHQRVTIDFAVDELPARCVLLSNGAHTVAVGPRATIELPAAPDHQSWHEAVVPAGAVWPVIGRLAALVPGLAAEVRARITDLGGTPLVSAAVLLPALAGWDAAGRPVYAEPSSCVEQEDEMAGITEASFSPDDEPPA